MRAMSSAPRPRVHSARETPRGVRSDRTAAVSTRRRVTLEHARCERCRAVYEKKTWRAGPRTRRASLEGVHWVLCPACAQVRDQEYFGRVLITASLGAGREVEVRRRIWHVECRARHTQPERRLVSIEKLSSGMEILTTSQKLAHRIAKELEKAFGGKARYEWTDREGALEATWQPPATSAGRLARSPTAPRLRKARSPRART